MRKFTYNLLVKTIHWWEANILNHPWWLIVFSLIITGLVGKYTYDNLTINTNTADMLSTQLPFQQDRIRLETAFPQDVSTVLLLVEGKTPEQTSEAVKRIGEGLRRRGDEITSVYIPDEGEFFTRNGMLYLSLQELEDLSTQLANAQPFIGRLSQDNSLGGLFGILGQALEGKEDDIEIDLDPVLKQLREAIQANTEGRPFQLSWQQLMLDQQDGIGITKRFITVKPVLHFDELLPAEKAINAINQVVGAALTDDLAGASVRMTGEVVLEHEEMQTIGQGTAVASVVSMILVCLTLWIAYRSFKLMFATFFTLTMGLILSMGFAAVAIGHLNLISIAFAVLFIGMGDAYSSHFCLRYRELVLRGEEQREALIDTLTSTGAALILCTLTAAIGLYSFIPTSFIGVSELGVIAGTSMFIALLTTFTVLPALMKIMPLKVRKKPKAPGKLSALASNWPLRYARPIRYITVLLAVGATFLLTKIQVDFNPINLRDPNTESVKTFKYLLSHKDTSPMTLSALATTEAETLDKEARFAKLPTVEKVVTLFDFIPGDQETKLALIEQLALIVGPQLDKFPPPAEGGVKMETLTKFRHSAEVRLAKGENGVLAQLHETLGQFIAQMENEDPATRQVRLDRLQRSILGTLPTTIRNLREGLQANEVTLDSLPPDLVERWHSKDGLYRIQIFPKKDLNNLKDLRRFIRQAQKVDPNVTDLPVTYLESMSAAIRAFKEAFGLAMGAITVLLLLILRSVKDTLLVLLPLLLASLFTAAATVIFDVPFNFANIIALPLLFGLGVDSGIHMAHRLHYLHSTDQNLLGTSEAQGVLYGALTTVFSFSSLAFTSHQGTASMGILLAVGLMMTLICALVVLPAFSALRIKRLHSSA
jgi:hopanoid biosynthesis associated RND transporter like protein HpnN